MGDVRNYDYVSVTIIIICPQISPTVQYTVAENKTATISSAAAVRIHTELILLLSTLALFFCTVEVMLLNCESVTDKGRVCICSVFGLTTVRGVCWSNCY
ncbi:uncharacterized protein TM35_000151000 [Trypanosoma theileri]|uniref:Uncharacterized protein n=1 Tax=Trypanosoma theileri TaxID=67003 RepID=A0A1X0NWU0_9TRYP|nr:uncharacterized protein TM35_000151000 [Trypanosoma theileri]ORC88669.1 hypothetical protein TM35_000151000 [Trypanosoma theileri]